MFNAAVLPCVCLCAAGKVKNKDVFDKCCVVHREKPFYDATSDKSEED